jgi:glycopeptide antibiotics resistance protein
MPRRLRLAATVAAVYALGLALVAMWPHPVDDDIDVAGFPPLRWTTETLGLSPFQGYEVVQFSANVVLFMPLGALVLLVWRRAGVVYATLAGATVSTLVELLQHLVRPERIASVQDVLANTIGAAAGAGAVWVLRRLRRA